MDHNWHFNVCKLMISVGNLSILGDFWTLFWPKCSTAVSMATAMQMDERIVDYLVLGPNIQNRKVSAKSVTMRATALCKNLSGYRELLLKWQISAHMPNFSIFLTFFCMHFLNLQASSHKFQDKIHILK